ncbi:MAG: ribosome small subunit-dependent GTPase A [Paraclostridium sp.]|uniref:ribosome small subunit-dependent GTPase A n=1 Tax=Paraclostridium sp. TaxID=2023273 RepID=UPI003F3739B5
MNENFEKLYKLGLNEELRKYFEENFSDFLLGRISIQYSNVYIIESTNGDLSATITGKMEYKLTNKEDYPAVGDWVVFKQIDDKNAVINNILPRKTIISRKVAGSKSDNQILATNVDKIFITMSLNNDFNLRRLERYINIAWDSGAIPIIILTKADLCDDIKEKLNSIEDVSIGIDIIVTSALIGEGIELIKANINESNTVVFIGSSGVGKSTIINKLLNKDIQRTKDTGDNDKGRHTTTHRALFIAPSGGVIIDTPGMREIQLSQGDLESTFKDIEEISKNCYFKDCQHKSEPMCAVKEAIEKRELSKERLKSYEKIKKELIYAEKRKRSKERRTKK